MAMASARHSFFSVEMFGRTHKRRLHLATNLSLLVAIAIGVIVALNHGCKATVSISAFGASLAAGAVLGFLFGIPAPGSKPTKKGAGGPNPAGPGSASAGGVNPPTANPSIPNASTASAAAASATSSSVPAATNAPGDAGGTAGGNGKGGDSSGGAAAADGTGESNLEQVADWVTKLLLGGGLTQIKQIPPTVWRWAREVAIGVNSKAGPAEIEANQAFAAGLMIYGFVVGFFAGFLITKLQLGSALSDQ